MEVSARAVHGAPAFARRTLAQPAGRGRVFQGGEGVQLPLGGKRLDFDRACALLPGACTQRYNLAGSRGRGE